jgi:hypothetical protein
MELSTWNFLHGTFQFAKYNFLGKLEKIHNVDHSSPPPFHVVDSTLNTFNNNLEKNIITWEIIEHFPGKVHENIFLV